MRREFDCGICNLICQYFENSHGNDLLAHTYNLNRRNTMSSHNVRVYVVYSVIQILGEINAIKPNEKKMSVWYYRVNTLECRYGKK